MSSLDGQARRSGSAHAAMGVRRLERASRLRTVDNSRGREPSATTSDTGASKAYE